MVAQSEGASRSPDSDTRARILGSAARILERDPLARIQAIALGAGVSRATVHRYFATRAELLTALELEPHPATDERILAAAAELIGRDGLRNVSMDELASRAGVSRASVYRLFPGKGPLFAALVEAYSPFQVVERELAGAGDRPPREVLPHLLRVAARTMEPRIGIARTLLFEVTSGDPDALQAAQPAIRQLLGALGGYLARQMALGRVRRMHPVLAAQALIGPVLFHLLTRPIAARIVDFDMPLESAVAALADGALDGLLVTDEGADAIDPKREDEG